MTEATHLTAAELAARWKLKANTLKNWRSQGKGPEYTKVGKYALYPIIAVEAAERAGLVRPI